MKLLSHVIVKNHTIRGARPSEDLVHTGFFFRFKKHSKGTNDLLRVKAKGTSQTTSSCPLSSAYNA